MIDQFSRESQICHQTNLRRFEAMNWNENLDGKENEIRERLSFFSAALLEANPHLQ